MTGRTLHAGLHLLDRQVVALGDGRMVGKVDDLELDLDGTPPTVTALLTGPGAWGRRLPGLLGVLVVAIHRRLHPGEDPDAVRIPAADITEVGSAVIVARAPRNTVADWVDHHMISRIPGAGHAPE